MRNLAKDYLDDILSERYHDGTDRSNQRVFNGEDIENAFMAGARAAAFALDEIITDEEENE